VFDADLSSIFHLFRRAAYDCGKSGRRHRTGRADFALATDFRTGN
jgi:hypothetical protein